MIASIVVKRNLNVGFLQLNAVGQPEFQVFYVQSALYPHALIISLYRQNLTRFVVNTLRMIKVFRTQQDGQTVQLNHQPCISKEEIRVGFQMNRAPVNEEFAITIHKESRSQSLMRVLHLRIREGKPYLLHLIRREEAVDNFDTCTQESHILLPFFQRFLGTRPHTGTLYVYANKVYLRVKFG